MPNRILYEKICASDTLALLSAEEERFFYRLMVQCDDYGRFDGRATVIRSRCFTVQVDSISDDDVAHWLDALVRVGLVTLYRAEGRPYLQMVTFNKHQPRRAKKSKWPDPPPPAQHESERDSVEAANTCEQTPADVPVFVSGIRSSIFDIRSSDSEPDAAAPPSPPPEVKPLDVPEPLADFHAVLSEAPGYAPSATFLAAVSDRYGALDLREQALKMASWLADPTANKRLKQRATQRFVLDWLKRESTGPPGLPTRNGSSQQKPEIERMPVIVRRY